MRTILVGYRVHDLERSLAFYSALGYRVLGRVDLPDGTLAVLGLPDDPAASVELVHRSGGGAVDPGGFDHLAIQVDDLAAVRAAIAERGLEPGPVEQPGGPDGPRTAWLSDPDGYRIELVQWPPGHGWGMTEADFAADDTDA